jgi:hypothetical protein
MIPSVVSFQTVREELTTAATFAAVAGVQLDTATLSEINPYFYATFFNINGEPFVAEFNCQEYPLHPPTIEFLDLARVERGLSRLYPDCFHTMPCICMRYNRKAYQELGGPHGDWRLIDWHLPTSGGGTLDSLTMILSDLHAKISRTIGRLG